MVNYIVIKKTMKKLFIKMKKLIFFLTGILLITLAFAITDGCGDEVDINTPCVVRTPPITCSTYDLYNSSNNLTIDDGSMEEVFAGSGIYNFTFLPNASGIHSIVLCDNTSTQINVETTTQTDLATIIEGIQTNATDIKVNATSAQSNVFTILANTAVLSSEHSALETGIQNNATDIKVNATAAQSDVTTILANTITLSNQHTNLGTGIQNNATDVKVNSSALAILIMQNITSTAEEIKVNVTSTDFASNVWAYAGTIVDNILNRIANFTFRTIIQNVTYIPLVNLTSGLLLNETVIYQDGTEVVTKFKYNFTDFRIENSSSTRKN